jgi:pimeloyl-ACP methyl ester carboxylesterase
MHSHCYFSMYQILPSRIQSRFPCALVSLVVDELNPMPFLELPCSPHAPGVRPVKIHFRDVGRGRPVIFLHGGWGYRVYPITRQIKAFEGKARFIIPDRSGHGRSTPSPGPLPVDFHQRAAEETLLVLDALAIKRAIFWGHSDGAVIAAKIGLSAPERCDRLLLEAFHFEPGKPNSRSFFKQFATHPEDVTEKMQRLLIADHGKDENKNEDRWKKVVERNCRVWLKLAAQSKRPDHDLPDNDLFEGRLSRLKVPVTFIHGRGDPRTEPGEMERVHEALPLARMRFVETGRHSPHSERKSWQKCNEILSEFLAGK